MTRAAEADWDFEPSGSWDPIPASESALAWHEEAPLSTHTALRMPRFRTSVFSVRGFLTTDSRLKKMEEEVTLGHELSDAAVLAVGGFARFDAPARVWLGDAIDALVADVPEEEWDKIPSDFACSVDRELYSRDR
jgi:hypothetical protein